ncbi:MAG: sigma-70 family RNA polymerase sigma factor [Cyanobacteria bacterium P01_D01_bin.128]
MNASNPPPAVQQFNEAIYVLLKVNTAHSKSLLAYIRRLLWQYHLDRQLTATEIFIDAYVRGVQYLLSSGETIKKPSAWMRITVLNVIREKSRERKRSIPLTWEVVSDDMDKTSTSESGDEECFLAVIQAFNNLNHDDRKIIQLRFFESKSWEEVREKVGESDLTTSTLRKRGQRALERLRREYHKIRPSHLKDSE